ncbi:MAG TPA: BatA domain-containing protein [Tepidisphaeraceae bacterium]|jgi:hypothetical protein
MGLLAPLYIAGVLAVGLPILFHLIRRTPHSRQAFSSLMFLSQSPPRLTRRSRLTNILLLILRAAALTILALAFARPFFSRGAETSHNPARGHRVAILIDTSASMRRGDLWQQANKQVEEALREVSPTDEVALYAFDDHTRPAMTFKEWTELEPSRRAAVLRAHLADLKPTWAGTKLGDALAAVADSLAETEAGQHGDDRMLRQLVLVSDLQQGSHVESLQGYQWPANVTLGVRAVALKPEKATNAGVQFIKPSSDGSENAADARKLRVRVANAPDSTREQFSLAWANDAGAIPQSPPLKVYVPPGRSQVVRVSWPVGNQRADRLVLEGDDSDFDNTLYVVPPRTESVRVIYVGDDNADDVKGLGYYLHSAATAEPDRRRVELVTRRPQDRLGDADLVGARLVVVAAPLPDATTTLLRRFADAGGDVSWILTDAGQAKSLLQLLGTGDVKVEEATGKDYALIGHVDTEHPLFAPFADARFGDFTKIHFWKHRRLTLAKPDQARVLARFDDGDPFLLERTIGKGRVVVATSGWQPADSQLALSTKFVPLIDGLLRRHDGALVEAQYGVGDRVGLPVVAGQQSRTLAGPDGKAIDLAAGASAFEGTDRPGIYRLTTNGEETALAVNLSPDESRTAPLPVEDLERWGAKLTAKPSAAPTTEEAAMRERRLRGIELENRQKLWRWLIVGVLGLLAVETALAGRTARKNRKEQATT